MPLTVVRLTIYLMRETVLSLEEVLPASKEANGWERISPKASLGYPCAAWIQKNKVTPPRWLEFVSASFDVPPIKNRSSSFLLALKVRSRVFVMVFGYAKSVLDRSMIVPDFGLRVALNTMPDGRLDSVATRTPDRVTKQAQMHFNSVRPVEEFGIVPEADWIRSVRGTVQLRGFAGKIEGRDAISFDWKGDMKTLEGCCNTLLVQYASKAYQKRYSFIDYLVSIKDVEPIVKELDDQIMARIAAGDWTGMGVALVEPLHPELDHYRIWMGRNQTFPSEMEPNGIQSWLEQRSAAAGRSVDSKKVHVLAMNGEGKPVGGKHSLWDYLVAQVERSDGVYVLSLGEWYRTDRNYLQDLRRDIEGIEDVTANLQLPVWKKGESEADYNSRVCRIKKWRRVDKELYRFGHHQNKIECADILTDAQDFIHVKHARSSATLSHLFAQGYVSSQSYSADVDYRRQISQDWNASFQKRLRRPFDPEQSGMRVIFAIGTDKPGKLSESLFFFSLVNLRRQVRAIQTMRWKCAICRIEKQE